MLLTLVVMMLDGLGPRRGGPLAPGKPPPGRPGRDRPGLCGRSRGCIPGGYRGHHSASSASWSCSAGPWPSSARTSPSPGRGEANFALLFTRAASSTSTTIRGSARRSRPPRSRPAVCSSTPGSRAWTCPGFLEAVDQTEPVSIPGVRRALDRGLPGRARRRGRRTAPPLPRRCAAPPGRRPPARARGTLVALRRRGRSGSSVRRHRGVPRVNPPSACAGAPASSRGAELVEPAAEAVEPLEQLLVLADGLAGLLGHDRERAARLEHAALDLVERAKPCRCATVSSSDTVSSSLASALRITGRRGSGRSAGPRSTGRAGDGGTGSGRPGS